MSATNNPSIFGRIKHGAHSLIALAFLFLPLVMTGLFLYNTGAGSLAAWSERSPNEQLASCKVVSRDAELFKEPVVSVTFDDGWRSVAETAAPLLCEYGVASTQYVLTGDMTNATYMSPAQVIAMHDAGHEIASHSITHMALGEAPENDVRRELESSRNTLLRMGVADADTINFAYPYGSRSETSDRIGLENYNSLRGTFGGAFDPGKLNVREGFDPKHIASYTIENDVDADTFRSILKYVKQTNGWLILALHQVDDSGQTYAITDDQLKMLLETLRDEGIKTMTVRDALESYRGDA